MRLIPSFGANCALFGLVVLALVTWWLRTRPYRAGFRFPSRRDDACGCRGDHQKVSVSLERGGFDWPVGVVGRGQTAFVTLNVEATFLGRFFDPFIEVRQGQTSYRQYFERGATGRRYLNLSPVFNDGGEGTPGRVTLRGGWLHWEREATVALFDPPAVNGAKVLVLAPHPDDAEIAAFGMYAGRPSWVATMTAGAGGMANLSSVIPDAHTSRWSANLRFWDSVTVPQLGGVPRERCLNLGQPDGQLQNMYGQPTRQFNIACEESLSRSVLRSRNVPADFQGGDPGCTWTAFVEEMRLLVETSNPDIVVCPHPMIDGHHDHVFTTVALQEALRQLPSKSRLFFLYVVHRRGVPLYPFGSADTVVSLPPWTDHEWLADAVYSHPLAPDIQRGKYFAIESTHDLRNYQTGAPRTLRQVLMAVWREISAFMSGTGSPAGSFLRRAARPNEIYWVVSHGSLSELVTRALGHRSAPRHLETPARSRPVSSAVER